MKRNLIIVRGQGLAVLRKCLILCSMLLTASITVGAQQFEVGDLCYRVFSEDDRTVAVTNYVGNPIDMVIPGSVENGGVKYSVTHIGVDAFVGCSSLVSVTIPESVTNIGLYAFMSCTSLASVTIPNSVTSIGQMAFMDCSSLVSVAISNSVTSIEYGVFGGCTSLTSVTIPNSVTSIGELAFQGCTSLTSVTIPNSVTSIGKLAFQECTSLTSVIIPNCVTSIGRDAFSGCSSLEEILVEAENAHYCSENGILYNKDKTELVMCPATKKEVSIPNSVTSIGDYAFYACKSMDSVTIPNSVTSIGDYAFYACRSLASVIISEAVTSIGDYAFSGCWSLTSVTIPNSVTRIGEGAFESCFYMASITIPNSVTRIGNGAFKDCISMKTIYSEPTTPPQADRDTFIGVPTYAVVYVPGGTTEVYSRAEGWRYFTDIQENTSGVSELAVDRNARPADVYNMQGILVKARASQADIDALVPGIYIIGGRKVLVK